MERMTAVVSNRLLCLDDRGKDERDCITVSALGAPDCSEIHINHPLYDLRCKNPQITHNGDKSVIYECTQHLREPYQVGDRITTRGAPEENPLSEFKLEDHNFPCKGVHTLIKLSVMERRACMDIVSKDRKTLQFNRTHDVSNVKEAL